MKPLEARRQFAGRLAANGIEIPAATHDDLMIEFDLMLGQIARLRGFVAPATEPASIHCVRVHGSHGDA